MLSVVVPAYNEAAFLTHSIGNIAEGLLGLGEPFEIVVVENGSTDGTRDVLASLVDDLPQVRAITLPEANYGLALRRGLEAAVGDHAAIFDVDYYDLAFLKDAVGLLDAPDGPGIVVGSKRGIGAVDRRPWHRRTVTTVFSAILRVLFGLTVPDTHGIKMLDLHRTRTLLATCRCRHDLFDSELVIRAERSGIRVDYLPVEVVELRPPRSSLLRRIPRTLLGLARLRVSLWQEPAYQH